MKLPADYPTIGEDWYPDRYNNTSDWTFWGPTWSDEGGKCTLPFLRCPYGEVGDRFWVREALRCNDEGNWRFEADGQSIKTPDRPWATRNGYYYHPARFLPRNVARIFLEITEIRAECLQNISEADAQAEGAPAFHQVNWTTGEELGATYVGGFKRIWESINGEDSWDSNPWVWVISFKRCDQQAQTQKDGEK